MFKKLYLLWMQKEKSKESVSLYLGLWVTWFKVNEGILDGVLSRRLKMHNEA